MRTRRTSASRSVVFEQDGERWVRSLAVGWTKELVTVELAEQDSDTITVRLYPEDVKRGRLTPPRGIGIVEYR
jgi:hypothetical protein